MLVLSLRNLISRYYLVFDWSVWWSGFSIKSSTPTSNSFSRSFMTCHLQTLILDWTWQFAIRFWYMCQFVTCCIIGTKMTDVFRENWNFLKLCRFFRESSILSVTYWSRLIHFGFLIFNIICSYFILTRHMWQFLRVSSIWVEHLV